MSRTRAQVVEALAEAGLVLPEVNTPLADYRPSIRSGLLVQVSGQLPMREGALAYTGTLGSAGLPIVEGQQAASLCALGLIAAAFVDVGEQEALACAKVNVYVAVDQRFTDMPLVANGASKVLGIAFGAPHARSAVGVCSLPLGAPVEVDGVFTVDPTA